jgi:pimeloyl-ACP methyl ester carboxylesterase
MHITEWGDPSSPPVIMWHGLSRTGRDFDVIAHHLSRRFYVLCPDTIGRGLSSWSSDPFNDYTTPTYIAHAVNMLDAFGFEECYWIGTSMGGIIGMGLASSPLGFRIKKLVLNDIGAEIHAPALDRIRAYVTQSPEFPTMSEFETYVRKVHAPFGTHSDDQWRHMAETSFRRKENGLITNHFDPQVMDVFASTFAVNNPMLWDLYDKITCPTLLLRGENSDLLPMEVATSMTERGPHAKMTSIPGCGHAPGLNTAEQILIVEDFLLYNSPTSL